MNRSEIASCTRARIRISLHRFFLFSLFLFLFQSLFCRHLLPHAASFSGMVFDVFYTTGIRYDRMLLLLLSLVVYGLRCLVSFG